MHLKEFNGFIHKNQQQQKLTLPLNNSENALSNKCVDILKEQRAESMFAVEFDLTKLNINEETQNAQDYRAFRIIN